MTCPECDDLRRRLAIALDRIAHIEAERDYWIDQTDDAVTAKVIAGHLNETPSEVEEL